MAFPVYDQQKEINPAPIETGDKVRVFVRQMNGMCGGWEKPLSVKEYESVEEIFQAFPHFIPSKVSQENGALVWTGGIDHRFHVVVVGVENPYLWALYDQCEKPKHVVEPSAEIAQRISRLKELEEELALAYQRWEELEI